MKSEITAKKLAIAGFYFFLSERIFFMTKDRALELLKIEHECVLRNENGCDRDCANCDLVQETDELLEMYKFVIEFLNHAKE